MVPSVPHRTPAAGTRVPSASHPVGPLTAAERELVRRSWAHARRDAPRFTAALHAALARRVPALARFAGEADAYDAGVERIAHTVDVAVRHLDRLLASAGGAVVPGVITDPVGAAVLDAVAACHAPRLLPTATRVAWRHTWAAVCACLRPPAPPETAAHAA